MLRYLPLALLLLGSLLPAVASDTPAAAVVPELSVRLSKSVYLSNIWVKKSKCGPKIWKGAHRLSGSLERDHFKGHTETRGYASSSSTLVEVQSNVVKVKWPDAFVVPIDREDELKNVLRMTLESRNGSLGVWRKEARAEFPIAKMIGEEAESPFCAILFHKRISNSKTYRRDKCDNLLCATVEHPGSDVYPPEKMIKTLPMEAFWGACAVGMFVIYVVSGWIPAVSSGPSFRWIFYLIPLAAVGGVMYLRMQGMRHLDEGAIEVHSVTWGYGDGNSYGTEEDQEYSFELTAKFPSGDSAPVTSSKITDYAVSRSPEAVKWPEVISWPYAQASSVATLSVRVFADGKPLDPVYNLEFNASAPNPDQEPLCSEGPQPKLCLRTLAIAPPVLPEMTLLERLPGGWNLVYLMVPCFIVLYLQLRTKPPKDEVEAEEDTKKKK